MQISKNDTQVKIRNFLNEDAGPLSAIIIRCLKEVNSNDYSPTIIEGMVKEFTPTRVEELAARRQMYVAVRDNEIMGTVSREGNKIYTMFIDPRNSGQGIGYALMDHAEEEIRKNGYHRAELDASLTARGFYIKRGYTELQKSESDEYGMSYSMEKSLTA